MPLWWIKLSDVTKNKILECAFAPQQIQIGKKIK